jgi:glycosyltransferase involved in cell wall biosynthesis
VDAYPPVQYQAQLLAQAGHRVTLITTPRILEARGTSFTHSGIDIRCISSKNNFGGPLMRMRAFASALSKARRDAPRNSIEIAYDPMGAFYSDFVARRPERRVAHLHELLQFPNMFLERRLKRSVKAYDLVVVADTSRAALTQMTLGLGAAPLSIENYPLRASAPLDRGKPRKRFEVVYCGVLGLNQMLHVIIRSIPKWPDEADLILIGNKSTATAAALQKLTAELGLADRVQFLGWMDTPEAERRIAQSDLGIALLDSRFEQLRTALGASNKRFQFMKAALPQIGDGNPGVPELIQGNGVGTCVAEHEPEQIAAVVREYVENPGRRASEGARAFTLHQAEFNYERVFQRFLDRIEAW